MRQCIISCDSDERALKYVVDDFDGENIVWNTDYPHPDAIDPKRALPDLDAQPISDEARRKFFGTTPSSFLDRGFWLKLFILWKLTCRADPYPSDPVPR